MPVTIVMVTGAVPGLGKSTLCGSLGAALESQGHTVEHFAEADILTCDEFQDVIAAFRSTGSASREQLLDATRRYLDRCLRQRSRYVVQDMLLPYLPSLLAWGHSDQDIGAFFEDLARLASEVELLELHIEGDPHAAVLRASRREGMGWIEASIAKFGRYENAEPVSDLASLVRYMTHAQERSRRLLRGAPWTVITFDAASGADTVLTEALSAIGAGAP